MTPSDRAAPALRLSGSAIDPAMTSAPAAASGGRLGLRAAKADDLMASGNQLLDDRRANVCRSRR